MWTDIKRTLNIAFGWIFTILPIGIKISVPVIIVSILISYVLPFLGFLLFVAGVLVAFFFRNPKRETHFEPDEIACPADGTVLSVKTEDANTVVIRIFLSIFNVHVQRAPIDGKVEDVVYTPGTFAFADSPDADKNERNLIKISKNWKFAHVEQITGAIARRIECWVKKDEELKKGQLIGLIRFGSQVAVYLPKESVRILVKEGQKVEGGKTVLALLK